MIDKLLHGSLTTRLLVFILAVFLAAGGWYAPPEDAVDAPETPQTKE